MPDKGKETERCGGEGDREVDPPASSTWSDTSEEEEEEKPKGFIKRATGLVKNLRRTKSSVNMDDQDDQDVPRMPRLPFGVARRLGKRQASDQLNRDELAANNWAVKNTRRDVHYINSPEPYTPNKPPTTTSPGLSLFPSQHVKSPDPSSPLRNMTSSSSPGPFTFPTPANKQPQPSGLRNESVTPSPSPYVFPPSVIKSPTQSSLRNVASSPGLSFFPSPMTPSPLPSIPPMQSLHSRKRVRGADDRLQNVLLAPGQPQPNVPPPTFPLPPLPAMPPHRDTRSVTAHPKLQHNPGSAPSSTRQLHSAQSRRVMTTAANMPSAMRIDRPEDDVMRGTAMSPGASPSLTRQRGVDRYALSPLTAPNMPSTPIGTPIHPAIRQHAQQVIPADASWDDYSASRDISGDRADSNLDRELAEYERMKSNIEQHIQTLQAKKAAEEEFEKTESPHSQQMDGARCDASSAQSSHNSGTTVPDEVMDENWKLRKPDESDEEFRARQFHYARTLLLLANDSTLTEGEVRAVEPCNDGPDPAPPANDENVFDFSQHEQDTESNYSPSRKLEASIDNVVHLWENAHLSNDKQDVAMQDRNDMIHQDSNNSSRQVITHENNDETSQELRDDSDCDQDVNTVPHGSHNHLVRSERSNQSQLHHSPEHIVYEDPDEGSQTPSRYVFPTPPKPNHQPTSTDDSHDSEGLQEIRPRIKASRVQQALQALNSDELNFDFNETPDAGSWNDFAHSVNGKLMSKSTLKNFPFLRRSAGEEERTSSPDETTPVSPPKPGPLTHSATMPNIAAPKSLYRFSAYGVKPPPTLVQGSTAYREKYGLPALEFRTPEDQRCHPSHMFSWDTRKLACAEHEGTCASCNADCCLLQTGIHELNQTLPSTDSHCQGLIQEMVWDLQGHAPRVFDVFPTMLCCSTCRRKVCPNCAGRCKRHLCKAVICTDCAGGKDPWTACKCMGD